MLEFYKNFAAVYGTCWLVALGYSVIIQEHVQLGEFGFFGFLGISLVCGALMTFRSEQRPSAKTRPTGSEDRITNHWVDGRPLRESELGSEE